MIIGFSDELMMLSDDLALTVIVLYRRTYRLVKHHASFAHFFLKADNGRGINDSLLKPVLMCLYKSITYQESDYCTDKKQYHNNIKELNKANTKLFINEKKYEFQKYFVPSKVGIYTIRLNFNNLMKDCSYIFIIVNQ